MDINIEFDESGITEGLEKLKKKAEAKLKAYGTVTASKLEAKAKNEAKWTDRTGDARRSIKGFSRKVANSEIIRIKLQDGVHYGKYLEYCNGGKYAVIEPTVDSEAPGVVEGLRSLF